MESYLKNIDISILDNLLYTLNDDISDELSEIMSKHLSDKGYGLCNDFIINNGYPPNFVCHNYTYFYNNLFKDYRNVPINMFEMGVGVPLCMGSWAGSLKGWKEYFSNSFIFSADIDKNYLYKDDRITSLYVNQEESESIKELWQNLSNESFDLIIDDGPHTYTSNILFFKESFYKLKDKGLYIIEDIHLDFIDILYNDIIDFCNNNDIKINIVKLIIPYPKKFCHPLTNTILKMNNLIFIKKI